MEFSNALDLSERSSVAMEVMKGRKGPLRCMNRACQIRLLCTAQAEASKLVSPDVLI